MKIITYNVNGIRAALKKGFLSWVKSADPDVLCLQEVKAHKAQVQGELSLFENLGYHIYWHEAEKKGYSGVAILSKIKPNHVEIGCGIGDYDQEGRVIRADFDNVSVMSLYIPSGSSGDERQDYKMHWLAEFLKYAKSLKDEIPHLLICGDFNICHTEIDIHNPKANARSSGFLPEERQWLSDFLGLGFIDSFRFFNKEPHNYSWWSYRANARVKNLGWRIDYNMASSQMKARLKSAAILNKAMHSDHCPVLLEIN
ncbi:MAG: exodeoxyribonuclease III [Cytophagales bacterium]